MGKDILAHVSCPTSSLGKSDVDDSGHVMMTMTMVTVMMLKTTRTRTTPITRLTFMVVMMVMMVMMVTDAQLSFCRPLIADTSEHPSTHHKASYM